jgi:hypothetical protein
MPRNPFVVALGVITGVLAGIAFIAWLVSLGKGSGYEIALALVAITVPGAFFALLAALVAGASGWTPTTFAPAQRDVPTPARPQRSEHWLATTPGEASAPPVVEEPDTL